MISVLVTIAFDRDAIGGLTVWIPAINNSVLQ